MGHVRWVAFDKLISLVSGLLWTGGIFGHKGENLPGAWRQEYLRYLGKGVRDAILPPLTVPLLLLFSSQLKSSNTSKTATQSWKKAYLTCNFLALLGQMVPRTPFNIWHDLTICFAFPHQFSTPLKPGGSGPSPLTIQLPVSNVHKSAWLELFTSISILS